MTSYEMKRTDMVKRIPAYIEDGFADSGCFGHLFDRHINKSDADMMRRCARKKENVSSFIGNESDIVGAVKDVLRKNAEEIAEWMADDTDQDDWSVYGNIKDYPIQGKIFLYNGKHNWKKGAKNCSEFVIALSKSGDGNPGLFRIRSCYPIL
ncbi:hypothetical protein LKD70_16330 [Ruminococcus sp. CLA-AA-H200]|uniref:Bacterial CdiA-CT RNAse A domain-containing protein n=1 Tax=Ruminococcus turbiniformis TaxID=2881258 RepID=A0ABS8G0W6_9FIRM|nr:RNase A-like domain-containing protein [Ruminococcus turbiniformis]MCC2255960.1 hypothetical protein [Ruminococcus turbiniformis]